MLTPVTLLRLAALAAALLLLPTSHAAAQSSPRPVTVTSGTTNCSAGINCLQVSMLGVPSLGIDITGTGTWTMVVQGLRGPEGVATWTTVGVVRDSDRTIVTSATAAGVFALPNSGFTAVRIYPSSWTSGNPVISATPGQLPPLSASSGGGGGSGDASLSEQQAQTALLGTIDADTSAAMTSLQLIDNIPIQIGSTTSAQWGVLGFGAVTTAAPTYTTAQSHPLSLQTDGSLRTAVTNTVTVGSHAVTNAGTFATQAAQSGTWTVQPGNTANTTAWLVAGGLANDGVAAATNRIATLPGLVETSAPTRTNGRNAGFSFTVGGSARMMMSDANGAAVSLAADTPHGSAVATSGPQIMVDARSAEATAVTTGQASRAVGDLVGRQITLPFAVSGDIVTATPVGITDGASTSILAAQGASVRTYVTDIECANSSATNVTVDIRDGTAGAVLWTLSCPATGGNNRAFTLPLRGSANTAIAADPSASASTVTISMRGYKSTQ